ncbi:chaperone NapD [Flagellimonas onchidii]|uniref:chaperone NapD n=1 Tax=Flagellimonas onchidii TaxID=2562684 RepID=UPI0010A5E920|nr:chaperone NapD [Allomuricauda onchidii]
MPIKSYLVHPAEGKKETLTNELSNMQHCEVVPAENEEVLILITETDSKQEEEELKQNLEKISDIKLMALVSGFNTPKNS